MAIHGEVLLQFRIKGLGRCVSDCCLDNTTAGVLEQSLNSGRPRKPTDRH